MSQELQSITENNFTLGYNDRDKPESLRTKMTGGLQVYMADIVNAYVDENKIIKRDGYSAIGDASVLTAILGQDRHEPYGGSKYVLRAHNNAGGTYAEIEGWSGSGNFTSLTGGTTQTVSALHTFVTVNDATYIFNSAGDVVLKTTNGTTASAVAAIPQGTGGMWFHNFFFVFGVSTQRSRLYFSDVNTPETFDATNGYIDVNPGDNEAITALSVLNDQLLIFKSNRVWGLTGFGTSDFTVDDLGERVTSIGTDAPRSVVATGNDVYYLSYRGGVPHFRSVTRTQDGTIVSGEIISDVITGTMKRINTTYIYKCAGEFDGRRIWWAVATGTSTYNNEVLVYDTITGGWTRMTGINASVFHISTISGVPQLYFASATANGKSYQMDTSGDDDGEAIDFVVKTPLYSLKPGHKCKYKYLYLTADSAQNVDLDVDFSPNGFTFDNLATVDLTGRGAAFGYATFGYSCFGATTLTKTRLDAAGGTAYYMQYRYENNVINNDVTLREWDIFVKPRGLRST